MAAAFALGAASLIVVLVVFNEDEESEPVLAGFLERPRVVPSPQPTVGSDAVARAVIDQNSSENLHFDQPAGELWWDAPSAKNIRWRLVPAVGVDPDRAPVDPDKLAAPTDPDQAAAATPGEADAAVDPELLPGAFVAPQTVFSLSDGRCDAAPELRSRYGIPEMIAVEDARWFWPVRAVARDQSWFNTGFSHAGWQIFQADDPDQAFLVYGPNPNFAVEYRTFLCPGPA